MIDINNISYSYKGSRPVYSQFSIRLEDNRIYGLLGKNGSGKSTLLYLMSGLLRPSEGTVCVEGHDTRSRKAAMLRDVFIVPEEFSLPDTTLARYIKAVMPFYPHFSREVLEQCLRDFDLPSRLHLGSLSMGQKKKVYMSVALASGTRVLLLDEPTNGLDIPSKSQFRKVVAGCMSEGRIVVISTHQVRDVEALLDHIVVIDGGRTLLNASTADVCGSLRFELRKPGSSMDGVLYAERSLRGDTVVAPLREGDEETSLDLELLFGAVAAGKVGMDNIKCGASGAVS